MKSILVLMFLAHICHAQKISRAEADAIAAAKPEKSAPAPTRSELLLRNFPEGSKKFEMAYDHYVWKKKPKNYPREVTILQTLEEGVFLVDGDFVLRRPGFKAADKTTLKLHLAPSNELYDFVTVLGARRRLKVSTVEESPKPFDRADFIAKMKNGENFIITREGSPKTCASCNGAGRIPSKAGQRSGDGKELCIACGGSGKQKVVHELLVKW